jgi:peptide deformylase
MPVKEVILLGNPAIRENAKKIQSFDENLVSIIADVKDTLLFLQDTKKIGRALAAPQIGHMVDVIFFNLPSRSFIMINPEITWKSQELFEVWDSCFCFDVSFFIKIERYNQIKVKYQDESGNHIIEDFSGDLSELVQHEIDHLYGILATDHLKENKNIIMRDEWEKRYR